MSRTVRILNSIVCNRFVWYAAGLADATILIYVVKHLGWV